MTTRESARDRLGTSRRAQLVGGRLAGVGRTVTRAVRRAGVTAGAVLGRVPSTMRATRAGAHGTTSALQTLPDTTLRSLAASSIGLGAGFYLAGAPRVAIAAGVAPAVILGAAMVLRPTEASVPPEMSR